MTMSCLEKTLAPIPAAAGIGLKPQHFDEILQQRPGIGWFEVHPENYMMDGGPMLDYLSRIREHYPLSLHSVGMSLGSADGVDLEHISRIKALAERFQPDIISDHLSWCRWQSTSLNDLLPMPYTRKALAIMLGNLAQVQNCLGRTIAIENPSSYFNLADAEMSEVEFLVELARSGGASILLDVNNVYVSACNHGWSAQDYLDAIPAELVSEIHLAGHKVEQVSSGELRIDDHGSRVCDEVWDLYRYSIDRIGARPTLIEWDTDVPEFSVLMEEATTADRFLQTVRSSQSVKLNMAG